MYLKFFLGLLIIFSLPATVFAKPKFDEIIKVSHDSFGNIVCGRKGEIFTLGKLDKKGRFSSTEKTFNKKN